MKIRKNKFGRKQLYLLACLVLTSNACTKIIEIVPEFETAGYSGYVSCYNAFGELADNSGVVVSIDHLEEVNTVTDETGFFELTVPIGNYSINYTKPGFGTYVHDPVNFIGGTIPVIHFDANLFAPVEATLLEHSIVYDAAGDIIRCSGKATGTSPFAIKMGIKYDLDSDYTWLYGNWGTETNYASENEFKTSIGFLFYNLDEHKTVHIAIYATNYYDWGYTMNNDIVYGTAQLLSDFVTIQIE